MNTVRVGIICATLSDGQEAQEKMPPSPTGDEVHVTLIPMNGLHQARGRVLDFVIWTGQAELHPNFKKAQEIVMPCLASGRR